MGEVTKRKADPCAPPPTTAEGSASSSPAWGRSHVQTCVYFHSSFLSLSVEPPPPPSVPRPARAASRRWEAAPTGTVALLAEVAQARGALCPCTRASLGDFLPPDRWVLVPEHCRPSAGHSSLPPLSWTRSAHDPPSPRFQPRPTAGSVGAQAPAPLPLGAPPPPTPL